MELSLSVSALALSPSARNRVNGRLRQLSSPNKHCAASTPVSGEQESRMTMSRIADGSNCHFSRISQSSPLLPGMKCSCAAENNSQVVSLRRRILGQKNKQANEHDEKKKSASKTWKTGLKEKIIRHLCSSASASILEEMKTGKASKCESPMTKNATNLFPLEVSSNFRRGSILRQSKRWKYKCRSSLRLNIGNDFQQKCKPTETAFQVQIRFLSEDVVLGKNGRRLFQTIIRDGKSYTWC